MPASTVQRGLNLNEAEAGVRCHRPALTSADLTGVVDGLGDRLSGFFSVESVVLPSSGLNATRSPRFLRTFVTFSRPQWFRIAKTQAVLGLTKALDAAAAKPYVRMCDSGFDGLARAHDVRSLALPLSHSPSLPLSLSHALTLSRSLALTLSVCSCVWF